MFSFLATCSSIVVIACSSAGVVVSVVQAKGGSTKSNATTFELPGITCSDLKRTFGAVVKDPDHRCR